MTDKEIIKALEKQGCVNCSIGCEGYKTSLDCVAGLSKQALDLINRQQAEIEDMKHEREILIEDIHSLSDQLNELQEELEDACIGVKSYKGKYESAVETARELKLVIAEKQADVERLQKELALKGLEYRLLEREKAEDISGFVDDLKLARTEAIKEFADILAEKFIILFHLEYNQAENLRMTVKQMAKGMVGEK